MLEAQRARLALLEEKVREVLNMIRSLNEMVRRTKRELSSHF